MQLSKYKTVSNTMRTMTKPIGIYKVSFRVILYFISSQYGGFLFFRSCCFILLTWTNVAKPQAFDIDIVCSSPPYKIFNLTILMEIFTHYLHKQNIELFVKISTWFL